MKIKIIDYWDVWGNEEEGFEVNDCSSRGFIEIDDNATDQEILNELIKIGLFNYTTTLNDIKFAWSDESYCELTQTKDGRPLGCLEGQYE